MELVHNFISSYEDWDSSVHIGLNIPPWMESQNLKQELLAKIKIKSKDILQTEKQNHRTRSAGVIWLCILHFSG